MRKIIKQSIALLLALCMCLPMFGELVFAVGEAAQDSTVITFGSNDGVTRYNNQEPRFTAGQDFGAWSFIGGKSLNTTRITDTFLQANAFTQSRWAILRLDDLASGKYDLTFSASQGDAKVYLMPDSQVEDVDAFTGALNETVDSYLGQLSVSKTYNDVQLPEDGDYLLVFNGACASNVNFRVSSIRLTRTGDAELPPEESTDPSGGEDEEDDTIVPNPDFTFNSGSDVTYKTSDSGDSKLLTGQTFGNWTFMGSRASVNLTPNYMQPNFSSAGSWLALKLDNIVAGTYDLTFGVSRNSDNGVVEIRVLPGDTTNVGAAADSAVVVGTVDSYNGAATSQSAGKITFEEDGSYILMVVSKSISPLNTTAAANSTAYRARLADLTMYMTTADADTPSVKATTPAPAPGPGEGGEGGGEGGEGGGEDDDDQPENTADYIFSSGDGTTYKTSAEGDTKLTVGKNFGNWTYMGSNGNVNLGSYIQANFYGAGDWMAVRLEDVVAGTYSLDFTVSCNDKNGVVDVYVLPGDTTDIKATLASAVAVGSVDGYIGAPSKQTAGKVTFEIDGTYLLVAVAKSLSPLNADTETGAYRTRLADLTVTAAEADANTPSVNATTPATPPALPPELDSDYVFSSGDGVTYKTSATDDTKLKAGMVFGNWTFMGSKSNVNLSTYTQANFYGVGEWMAVKLNEVTAGTYDLTFGVTRNNAHGVVEVYVLPGDTTDIAEGLKTATGIGTVDGYTGAPSKQTAGKVTFEANGSYLLVIVSKSISPLNTEAAADSKAFRARLTTLDLEAAEAQANTAKVQPTGGAQKGGDTPAETPTFDYTFSSGSDVSFSTKATDATLLTAEKTFGNWAFLWSKSTTVVAPGYLACNFTKGAWTAIRIDNVKAGTYELSFRMNRNDANGVIEVIILPGDIGADSKALTNALDEAQPPIGSFDGYKGAAINQIAGKVTFTADGSYTLVFRSKNSSPLNTEGSAYRMRIVGLNLVKATADANTPSFDPQSPYVPDPNYVFSSGNDTTYTPKGTAEEGNLLKENMVFGNWSYIDSTNTVTVAPAYSQAVFGSAGAWVAYRLEGVKAGTYNLSFIVSRNKACGVSDVIVLPGNTTLSTYYVKAMASEWSPVGTIDCYSKAKEKQTLSAVEFATDGDYILLFRAKAQSPLNPDATAETNYYRMRVTSLTLLPTEEKAVQRVISNDPSDPLGKYEKHEVVDLGSPVAGAFTVSGKTAMAKVNGDDYYFVPIRGGAMYVFNLDTKEVVDVVSIEPSVPRGVAVDNHGKVYISGDNPYISIYDMHTKETQHLRMTDTGASKGWDMVFAPETDMLYIASDPALITCYNTLTGEFSDFGANNLCEINPVFQYIRAITYADGYLYTCATGTDTKGQVQAELWKIDAKTGKRVASHDFYGKAIAGGPLKQLDYLSVVDGKLFCGQLNMRDAYILDCQTMERIETGKTPALTGMMTEVVDGKSYFIATQGRGLWEYDVETDTFSQVPEFKRAGKAFRANVGNVVGSDADPNLGEKSLIVCTNKEGIYFYNLETGKSIGWTDFLQDCGSGGMSMRAIEKGGPNQIFVGFYQDSTFFYYDSNSNKFSKSSCPLDQTDSFVYYGSKMYAGCYNGAQMFEYDPASGSVTTLADLNNGLNVGDTAYHQKRIHTLEVGDNKIFMGSLAFEITEYGTLSWYDLATGELYVERLGEGTDSGLQYSTIIDLVYHEGLLFGATSIHASNGLESLAKEGVIFVYDVENRKLLGEFEVKLDGINDPEWIAGINIDPNGKWWGLVDETLFSFEYDRASNTMSFKEEFSVIKDGIFEDRMSTSLFARPILFGDDGYIYVAFDTTGGLRRINPNDPYGDNVCLYKGGFIRDYVIGDDGDLYYYSGTLKRMELNIQARDDILVQKVINLINAIGEVTINSHPVIFTAREAYRKLTDEQKAMVTNYDVLVAAETRYAQIVEEAEAAAIVERINGIGKVNKRSRSKVAGIRRSYDALSDYAKSFVTNYDVLVAAEKALEEIKVASAVDELIEAIGEVTLESEAAIKAAREAYEALTDTQKSYVEKLDVLEAAEAALKELKGIGTNNLVQIIALCVAAAAFVAGVSVIVFVPSVRKKIFKRK